MNISEDKVRQASLHLSWVFSSNRPLEMLFKERHRPKQSGSGEETRVYAYFGLEVLDSATFEPPAKVQHSEVGDTTYEHSITDQLQHRIKELEKQLRTETKAKHQLEEKLATETEAWNQLEKDFAESPFQWHTVGKVFKQELDALYQAGGPFTDGPSTHKLLHDFSISMLSDQLSKHSPHLHAIISTLNSKVSKYFTTTSPLLHLYST